MRVLLADDHQLFLDGMAMLIADLEEEVLPQLGLHKCEFV